MHVFKATQRRSCVSIYQYDVYLSISKKKKTAEFVCQSIIHLSILATHYKIISVFPLFFCVKQYALIYDTLIRPLPYPYPTKRGVSTPPPPLIPKYVIFCIQGAFTPRWSAVLLLSPVQHSRGVRTKQVDFACLKF